MSAIGRDPEWVCPCGKTAMRALDQARCPYCRTKVIRTVAGHLLTIPEGQGEPKRYEPAK